jgi:hypothetical protein
MKNNICLCGHKEVDHLWWKRYECVESRKTSRFPNKKHADGSNYCYCNKFELFDEFNFLISELRKNEHL